MLHRRLFVTAFLAFCLLSGGLAFFLGRDYFPPWMLVSFACMSGAALG